MKYNTIKCAVVGDPNVGKTGLLLSYTSNNPLKNLDYNPTIFENYYTTSIVKKKACILDIWETSGHAEYDSFRPLSYPQTDVFIICFSLISPQSLENIKLKWLPEIRNCCKVPIIIVGTQSDLRTPEFGVTYEEGKKFADEINANKYLECSAILQEGIEQVFKEVQLSANSAIIKTIRTSPVFLLEKKNSKYKTLSKRFLRRLSNFHF